MPIQIAEPQQLVVCVTRGSPRRWRTSERASRPACTRSRRPARRPAARTGVTCARSAAAALAADARRATAPGVARRARLPAPARGPAACARLAAVAERGHPAAPEHGEQRASDTARAYDRARSGRTIATSLRRRGSPHHLVRPAPAASKRRGGSDSSRRRRRRNRNPCPRCTCARRTGADSSSPPCSPR
jgi:hypothetical protein